jgi:two-component system sensor histidine kinase RegB
MLRTLRSLLAPPITADPSRNVTKLAWLIRLRWIAISAQLLAAVPALSYDLLEPDLLPVYVSIVALLGVVNLASWMVQRRIPRPTQGHILFQLGVDIAAVSALLAIAGGAWNPMAPILFVHSGLGALLLQGRLSAVFFALLVACLVSIQAGAHIPPGLETGLVPATILFPAQLTIALVFWILTTWLSRTLAAVRDQLTFLNERKTRVDRLRAVGALAAGLSHELATPLNTAQLKLARLARRPELKNDADLSTADGALDRCGEVLRHMAGSQLKPDRLDLEELEVDDLVEQVCSSLSMVYEGATLHFRAEGRGSRRALLPGIAFSQALINLIENAIESAGENKPVEVVVSSRAGHIDVSVFDRGDGWPELARQHLGEPFVTTKPHGVGLGLYYVHTLAGAVGGDFSIHDRQDGGAVARISLPVAATGERESESQREVTA